MIAVDATVLAYAVNRFAPEHARASRLLEELANGGRPWVVPWPEVHRFVALVTHPHVVVRPLAAGDAWGFVGALETSPSVRLLGPTERHRDVVLEALAMGGPHGRGVETAAILREHGVRELLTSDRALRRFTFLDVRDPVHGDPWTPGASPARRYRRLTPRG
jgi:toxin-antitoxin system PIN domain toxin